MLQGKHRVKYLLTAILWLNVTQVYAFERYPGSMDQILKTDPEVAAQHSLESGDNSLLMVPDCFMGMPGYRGSKPPEPSPKILGKTCEELFGASGSTHNKEIKEWARQYNVYILQHNNAPQPTQ